MTSTVSVADLFAKADALMTPPTVLDDTGAPYPDKKPTLLELARAMRQFDIIPK